MGWSIALIENTLEFDDATAGKVDAWSDERMQGGTERVASDRHRLSFDPDDMEHMDYLHDEDLQKILVDGGALGRVCFGSLEGDDAGEFWGYKFGDGLSCRPLIGEVAWRERPSLHGRRFVFTGTMEIGRREASEMVTNRGGTVATSVGRGVTLVVSAALVAALVLDLEILTEKQFMELMGEG